MSHISGGILLRGLVLHACNRKIKKRRFCNKLRNAEPVAKRHLCLLGLRRRRIAIVGIHFIEQCSACSLIPATPASLRLTARMGRERGRREVCACSAQYCRPHNISPFCVQCAQRARERTASRRMLFDRWIPVLLSHYSFINQVITSRSKIHYLGV
jgi:hypothetical protein